MQSRIQNLYVHISCWLHFVAKSPNFKPPLRGFACSKIDALSFKRQDIVRSFFLVPQFFTSDFLCSQNAVEALYYTMILTAFPVISDGFTFKKHATFNYRFRPKLTTTEDSDSLRWCCIGQLGSGPSSVTVNPWQSVTFRKIQSDIFYHYYIIIIIILSDWINITNSQRKKPHKTCPEP